MGLKSWAANGGPLSFGQKLEFRPILLKPAPTRAEGHRLTGCSSLEWRTRIARWLKVIDAVWRLRQNVQELLTCHNLVPADSVKAGISSSSPLVIVAALSLVMAVAFPPSNARVAREAQRFLDSAVRPDGPGAAMLIANGDEVIFRGRAGSRPSNSMFRSLPIMHSASGLGDQNVHGRLDCEACGSGQVVA